MFPDNSELLHTLILVTVFAIPLCGSLELFALLAGLLLCITLTALLSKDKPLQHSLNHLKQNYAIAYYAGLSWLTFTFISLIIIIFEDHSLIRKLGGTARQVYILLEIGFALVLIYQISNKRVSANTIIYCLAGGFFTLIAYQTMALMHIATSDTIFWSWTPLMAPNIRDTGTIASAITIVFFCIASSSKQLKTVFIVSLLMTLSWTYLMWTGGRTGNAAILMMVSFISICYLFIPPFKPKALLIGLSSCFLAFNLCNQLAVYNWNSFQGVTKKHSGNIFNLTEGIPEIPETPIANRPQVNNKKTSDGRIRMWGNAWLAFQRAPIIGLGPNGWFFSPEKEASGATQDQPHNLFLQCLVEWGIIGSALFFTLLLGIVLPKLRGFIQAFKQQDSIYLASGSMILTLSLHSLTSGTYWNFQSVSIVVIAYSLWLSHASAANSSIQQNSHKTTANQT